MESIVFGKWRLRCDPQATRQAHECIKLGSPETCGCRDCLNFAAARNRVYPEEVLALFHLLGINPRHESEIWHLNQLKPGLHLYGGFFHFVGAIESEDGIPGPLEMDQQGRKPFGLLFADRKDLLPEPFLSLPVVQLEFLAHVLWVLSIPEPG